MRLRVLLLADSHLGFDLPVAPRIQRRRRGHDFLANHMRALEPALRGEVDLVVHGGDVFDRPHPHPTLVEQAFEPLRRVADAGVPVFVVPGNHERGRIPHVRFARHPGIHVFDAPRTFRLFVRGVRVALFGFPYARDRVRLRFPELVAATGWRSDDGDLSLLCVHHCVEGATVGPADFTFRRGPDVIRCADLPREAAAVLTGHVHRHQILTFDLHGRPLGTPVIYPGSVERTAFAEMGETKGYVIVDLEPASTSGRWRVRPGFHSLPTRPMVVTELRAGGLGAAELRARVDAALATAPSDAVLRLRVLGPVDPSACGALAPARLRGLAPEMNVEVVRVDEGGRVRSAAQAARRRRRVAAFLRAGSRAGELDLFGAREPVPARPQRS